MLNLPLLQAFQTLIEEIKVYRLRTIEIIFICVSEPVLLWSQRFVEGVLRLISLQVCPRVDGHTIDRMMTHGRSKLLTTSIASDVLPDPDEPAIPMILMSAHGGE